MKFLQVEYLFCFPLFSEMTSYIYWKVPVDLCDLFSKVYFFNWSTWDKYVFNNLNNACEWENCGYTKSKFTEACIWKIFILQRFRTSLRFFFFIFMICITGSGKEKKFTRENWRFIFYNMVLYIIDHYKVYYIFIYYIISLLSF